MFDGEPEYVPYFYARRPDAVAGKVKIYHVTAEDKDFPALFGKERVCLQECHNGNVIEIN